VDWTTRHSDSGALFTSKRYSEFATMSEDLASGTLTASFINVPLAMSLRQKYLAGEGGAPIKIVYLGHRDGTALMVKADSEIREFKDLRGKKILIPSGFSNQKLWMAKLCEENGMAPTDVEMVIAPPPEMPALLETGGCDAYVVGEPHCAKTEISGVGRVLLQVKDSWPDFISCVLVVREDLIQSDRALVQELVNGIAGSGLWLEESLDNRLSAADVAGKYYYNQKPELIRFVLQNPVDRVRYDHLAPAKDDLDEINQLGVKYGMFQKPLAFADYCDTSFTEGFGGGVLAMPPDDGLGIPGGVLEAPKKPPAAPAAPAGSPPAPAAPAAPPSKS
jgi:NitT/TauT family transport system substrate-binding protein